MSTEAIFIYGASGTTGALVAAALVARGARVVLVGRDRVRLRAVAARLGDPPVLVAAAHDPAALARAFAGARVVIGCAGPFARIGAPVLAAALAAGAHWIDLAREQAFLRASYEEHESTARRAGLAVVSGMGVEVALGDWAARCAAAALAGDATLADGTDRLVATPPLDELAIGYALDEFTPTPGTQRSLLATVTGPGVTWRSHRWDPVRPGARRLDLDFGPRGPRSARSFPAGEIITVPRHLEVAAVETYVALGGAWAMYERAAPLFALAGGVAGRWLDALLAPLVDPTRVPDADARARARFAVVAQARRGHERAQVVVAGGDVYATTATIAAEAALALATRTGGPVGVLAPSQAFAAGPRLRALAAAGVIGFDGPGALPG